MAEEQISDLEDEIAEITTTEKNNIKRMERIEDTLRDLWDNIKRTNIRIIRVPEEEEKKKGAEKIFEEIIVENFPNMGKEIVNQVQEVQRVPYRINPRRNTPRQILIKLSKIKYKEKRMKRNEDSLRDLWDNINCNNIRIIGVPEGEEKEKGPEKIFEEIIVENFPTMGKEITTQVQEVQRVPYRINPRRNTLRHIVIKLAKIKDKEKLLRAAREK